MTWSRVPGWFGFKRVYDIAIAEAHPGATFVELGTALGKSALYMAENIVGKGVHFHAIDSWDPLSPFIKEPRIKPHVEEHGGYYEAFDWFRSQSPFGYLVSPIKADIVEAASLFPDGSLDFVFLDADYSYNTAIRAIDAWVPKVANGGLFGGDNYQPVDTYLNTATAVDERFPLKEIYGQAYLMRIGRVGQ